MIQAFLASNRCLITLLFTLLLSQTVYCRSLPKCIQPCISSSATDAKCSENDFTCMCKIPLFSWSLLNCSRLYCSLESQMTAEGIIDSLCGTGDSQNTFAPTPTSPLPIFTFSGNLAHLSATTVSSAGQSTAFSSATGIPISISNPSTSEPGKNGNVSDNATSPQPLNSGTSAFSGSGLISKVRFFGWLAVLKVLVIVL